MEEHCSTSNSKANVSQLQVGFGNKKVENIRINIWSEVVFGIIPFPCIEAGEMEKIGLQQE